MRFQCIGRVRVLTTGHGMVMYKHLLKTAFSETAFGNTICFYIKQQITKQYKDTNLTLLVSCTSSFTHTLYTWLSPSLTLIFS